MGLGQLELQEPLVDALVSLLSANLNDTIDQLNATVTDGILVEHITQFLPYVPVPSSLVAGMPAVGIQELESEFRDDTQFSLNATHSYAPVAVLSNVDHRQLAVQLRRTAQAIAYVIQQDRLLGTVAGSGGVMRDQGGALAVTFKRTVPGPLLGDLDPNRPEAPPSSYLSWVAIVLESTRVEVN